MVVACWCIPTIPSHQSEASFSPPCNSNLVQRFLFDNDNKVARNSLCIFILGLKSAFMTSRTQETRLPGITRFTGTNLITRRIILEFGDTERVHQRENSAT